MAVVAEILFIESKNRSMAHVLRKIPGSETRGRFQAVEGMKLLLHDQVEAGRDSRVTIAFKLGGQAVLRPGMVVEIVSPTDAVDQASFLFRGKPGSVWAKFKEQKKEFQIQTAAGTLGGLEG